MQAPVASVIKDATIRGSEMVLRSALPYAAASRSAGGDKVAFINSTKFLVQNMLESFSKRLEIQLLYGGAGLGKVSSISGNVITVQTAEWADGIWAGAEQAPLEIRSSAGALRGSCSVSKVDLDLRTVEVDAAPAGIVSGDILWYKGAYGNEFDGLYNIITSSSTLFGISTTEYNLFKGNTSAVTGTLDFAKIEDAISKAVGKGLTNKVLVLCNQKSWTDLLTEQAAKRRHDYSYDSKEVKDGAMSIRFFGQNGEIEIRPSIYVKESHCFILDAAHLMRIGSSDITFKRPGNGEEFFRELENSAGFELRAYCDQSLFCSRPGVQTLISGIQN